VPPDWVSLPIKDKPNPTQYDKYSEHLLSVDSTAYTWDNNGNLLNDGVNTYAYDSANRLTAISGQQTATFYCNGLGDRLSQNGVNYTLDLNSGLTQVLSDGTNTYLYGIGRIAQVNTTTEYFLGDALGSVRQLTDAQGEITLANAYEPYGILAQTVGNAQTSYGFTGEFTDPSGMVYLRARYYNPNDGRFNTRDTWEGDYNSPLSLNRWLYVEGNPINNSDPSGKCTEDDETCWLYLENIETNYPFVDLHSNIDVGRNRYWKFDELTIIDVELSRLDRVAGIDFNSVFSKGEIEFVRSDRHWWYTDSCAGYNTFTGKLFIYDSYINNRVGCDASIPHEIAHQWDFKDNQQISKSFEKYVGASTFLFLYFTGPEDAPLYGVSGPPSRREDFATSFEEYVILESNGFSPTQIVIGEKRWTFIDVLLATGGPPEENSLSANPYCLPLVDLPIN